MILAILQARVSSTRLPGKALMPLLGKPMLIRQIDRVRRAGLIDRLLVATSSDASDDPLEKLCLENGIVCFRGSMDDVLDRFYQAAKPGKPDHVVRLTGDCPLTDPRLIDRVIAFHLRGGFDYTSNTVNPTFPDGLDVEVLRFSCLRQAWEEAKLPSQREHVTLFLHRHPERFSIGSLKNGSDLSSLRWTVDEPPDFELVTRIYEALYPSNPEFATEDILALLAGNPRLMDINAGYQRNAGLQKSLLEDERGKE
ncbi:MAG: spore coat protein [Peptococcaceae bacterium BRH_c4a]|nr:MAG: spore coat protein [Peptococcaceae bacterium BRH_c4a]